MSKTAEVIDLVDDSDDDSISSRESCKSYISLTSTKSTASSKRSFLSTTTQRSVPSYSKYVNYTQPSLSQSISEPVKKSKSSSKSTNYIEKEIQRQVTGKYKFDEIGVLISPLHSIKQFSDTLRQHFGAEDYPFSIFESDCFANNTIRFTYRPKVLGGAAPRGEDVITLPYAVTIFPSDEFVRLASLSTSETGVSLISFPQLGQAFDETLAILRDMDGCPAGMKVIYLLIDVEKEIMNYRKKLDKVSKSSMFDLNDAMVYLCYDKGLDIIPTISVQHACEYIYSITKIIAGRIYKNEATEFDKKHRITKLLPEDGASDAEKEVQMLRETWISMLQVIPQLSQEKARTFVRNGQYTCPMRLLDCYANSTQSEEEKALILQRHFSSKGRCEMKLSKELYNLFTKLDPSASIFD